MSDKDAKEPPKKNSKNKESRKSVKWDEKNVKETFHPANKTYGHMKIDECNTPYERSQPEDGEGVDPQELAARLEEVKAGNQNSQSSSNSNGPSEEMRKKHELFEKKRKEHYNEFLEAKKKLSMLKDDSDDEDENKDNERKNKKP